MGTYFKLLYQIFMKIFQTIRDLLFYSVSDSGFFAVLKDEGYSRVTKVPLTMCVSLSQKVTACSLIESEGIFYSFSVYFTIEQEFLQSRYASWPMFSTI